MGSGNGYAKYSEGENMLPYTPPNLVTAIQATKARRLADIFQLTYANILLRPAPKKSAKSSAIKLSFEEEDRIFALLNDNLRKWRWVVGQNHARYIYMEENNIIKITSVSGFYSGEIKNQFHVIEEFGKWLKVETLEAGGDWWKYPINPYLVQGVYTFKGALPRCGPVTLPVITASGFGWIERWQVE
jgi:hypothetical protein